MIHPLPESPDFVRLQRFTHPPVGILAEDLQRFAAVRLRAIDGA